MPGGGVWVDRYPMERPGVFIDVVSERPADITPGTKGVVLMPLIGWTYGPDREFFTIETKALNAQLSKLGFNTNYENEYTLPIRLAAQGAKELLCYNVRAGTRATVTVSPEPAEDPGTTVTPPETGGDTETPDTSVTLADETEVPAASALTATARYGGTRGNALSFSVTANPDGGYDVGIYLDAEGVERFDRLETAEQLIAQNSAWIEFSGTGPLFAIPGAPLEGATDAEITNNDVSKFLDAAESVKWNTLWFPISGTAEDPEDQPDRTKLLRMVAAKIQSLCEDAGKARKAIVAEYASDYERITNVTNGWKLKDGRTVDAVGAAAWFAGQDSSADKTTSLTNRVVPGASALDASLTNAEIVARLKRGELLFTMDDENRVVVEKDQNSLVTFERPKDKTYRKNRTVRTIDALCDEMRAAFPPNKFDNNELGYRLIEAIGRGILGQYETDDAIKNVVAEEDFYVDRERSRDDEIFIVVAVQTVDSGEKIYIYLRTK